MAVSFARLVLDGIIRVKHLFPRYVEITAAERVADGVGEEMKIVEFLVS